MEQKEQLSIELNEANKSYPTILNHREFIIKFENKDYNLRVQIDNQNIYFILTNLNELFGYNYKNKMDKNNRLALKIMCLQCPRIVAYTKSISQSSEPTKLIIALDFNNLTLLIQKGLFNSKLLNKWMNLCVIIKSTIPFG